MRASLKGPWMMSLGAHLAALLVLVLVLEHRPPERRGPDPTRPPVEKTRVAIAIPPTPPEREARQEQKPRKEKKEAPPPPERGRTEKREAGKGESAKESPPPPPAGGGERKPQGPERSQSPASPSDLPAGAGEPARQVGREDPKAADRPEARSSADEKERTRQEEELKARGRFTPMEKSREELEAFRRQEMLKVSPGDRDGLPALKVSYVNLLDQLLSYRGLAYRLIGLDRKNREEVLLVDPDQGDYRRVPFSHLDRALYSNRVFNPLAEGHEHFRELRSRIAAGEGMSPERLDLLFLVPKESLALLDWKVISAIRRSGHPVKQVGSATGHYQHLSNGSVVLVIDSFTLNGSGEEVRVTAVDPELEFLGGGGEGNS